MKKVLFIISNLESGGVSKSMVSLLNTIDRKRYDISVLIPNPVGLFMELLPAGIRIITHTEMAALGGKFRGLRTLLKEGKIGLALGHLIRMGLSVIDKGWAAWWLSRLMPPLHEEFDIVVDYNGQHQLYYMIDKIKAKKKITFFHSDYNRWNYYFRTDKRYYPKADYIFSVSAQCVTSLQENFPEVAHKIGCMENISNPELIERMAQERAIEMDDHLPTLLTLGHLCIKKGSDLAIRSAKILKSRGVRFRWYFLGQNSHDLDYEALIRQNGVEEEIVLLGLRVNPYPYIRQATLYVHPSQYEGKSIALDEAKLLEKPIVVTNFSTVRDQFEDRTNASICEMTPESLANAVEELLREESLQKRYTTYLHTHKSDNRSEIEKLYNLFDSVQ